MRYAKGTASGVEFELIYVPRDDKCAYWELDLEEELAKWGLMSPEQVLPDIFADEPPMARHMHWSEPLMFLYELRVL